MMQNKSKVENAVACFNEGFNCSQAILSTYCEDFGMDKNTALQVACGFGAGMGRLQQTCGAVTGAYMLISLKHGNSLAADNVAKEKTYTTIREFAKLFEERNNTTNCRALLGVDFGCGNNPVASERVRAVCPKMVKDAAEIIEEILFAHKAAK